MQSRVKSFEKRIGHEIEEKEGLLQDIEQITDLKVMPLKHYKERLIECRDLSVKYSDADQSVFNNLTFELKQGERVFLNGDNGCGKSTLIRVILDAIENDETRKSDGSIIMTGSLLVAPNIKVSYIDQDTSFLKGMLRDYAKSRDLDHSLLLALLRKLDMSREQFEKPMEDYSEGQKKKVLIAASLMTPAHLYIWDEPLNYIDVFSRMQIEKLIEKYEPTMLIVEHDVRFREKVGTTEIRL